ncbi:hypothetical protein J6590_071677 [Homalodisca vitripennis]|nr:hypothetical protein J6590_071677 [Homalodisca vitripennis]
MQPKNPELLKEERNLKKKKEHPLNTAQPRSDRDVRCAIIMPITHSVKGISLEMGSMESFGALTEEVNNFWPVYGAFLCHYRTSYSYSYIDQHEVRVRHAKCRATDFAEVQAYSNFHFRDVL